MTLEISEWKSAPTGAQWSHPGVFGFKLGRAVALVAVWRSSSLEGLQDLSTLVSPGVTGWSWPVSSTAPRRRCDSHSAKGCYGDAVLSALRDKVQWKNTIASIFAWKWDNRKVGSLTWQMSKYASIHYLQAVPTESQLRQPGHVAEHVWRQVLQLVVPQVQFLGQEMEVFMIFSWSV